MYKPGDGFVVPPGAPHAGNKNGDVKTKNSEHLYCRKRQTAGLAGVM